MTIDIDEEDFGTLCICALRYCHGRRTYMPSLVQRIVMAHFKDLSDRTLKVIADDEQFQSDMNLFGDLCDKVDWKNFYQILRERQKESSEQMSDIIRLKPCPFCGKTPQTVVDDETEELFGVKCFGCGGMIDAEKKTLYDAIKAWNRRADTPQTDEEYINSLPWTEKDCPWK